MKFDLRLPNGKIYRGLTRSKILEALRSGKLPKDAVVKNEHDRWISVTDWVESLRTRNDTSESKVSTVNLSEIHLAANQPETTDNNNPQNIEPLQSAGQRSADTSNSDSIAALPNSELDAWLEEHDLLPIRHLLVAEGFNLNNALTLTIEELKEIGVNQLGLRKRFLEAAAKNQSNDRRSTVQVANVQQLGEEGALSKVKSKLGVLAAIYFLTMFLPWVGAYGFNVSGWQLAGKGSHVFGGLVLLVYLIPVAACLVLYGLFQSDTRFITAKYLGFVPLAMLIGALFKANDMSGGNLGTLLKHLDPSKLPISVGYYLALIVGITLAFSRTSNATKMRFNFSKERKIAGALIISIVTIWTLVGSPEGIIRSGSGTAIFIVKSLLSLSGGVIIGSAFVLFVPKVRMHILSALVILLSLGARLLLTG
jgi:hypothetical protein